MQKRDNFYFEIFNFTLLDGDILNSSDLLEHLAMLLISTLAINCLLKKISNKAIDVINFAKHFLNPTVDSII